jgi:hypothetical protein
MRRGYMSNHSRFPQGESQNPYQQHPFGTQLRDQYGRLIPGEFNTATKTPMGLSGALTPPQTDPALQSSRDKAILAYADMLDSRGTVQGHAMAEKLRGRPIGDIVSAASGGSNARGTNPYYDRDAGQGGIGTNNAPGTAAFAGPYFWTGPSLQQKLPPASGERIAVRLPGANAIPARPPKNASDAEKEAWMDRVEATNRDIASPHDVVEKPAWKNPDPLGSNDPRIAVRENRQWKAFDDTDPNTDANLVATAGREAAASGRSVGLTTGPDGRAVASGDVMTRYGPVGVTPAPGMAAKVAADTAEATRRTASAGREVMSGIAGVPWIPDLPRRPTMPTEWQKSQIALQNQIIKDNPRIGIAGTPENEDFVARMNEDPTEDMRALAGDVSKKYAGSAKPPTVSSASAPVTPPPAQGSTDSIPRADTAAEARVRLDRARGNSLSEADAALIERRDNQLAAEHAQHSADVKDADATAKARIIDQFNAAHLENPIDTVKNPDYQPPTGYRAPTATSSPSQLPILDAADYPSKAQQWAASLRGVASEDGPGIVTQPQPNAGPLVPRTSRNQPANPAIGDSSTSTAQASENPAHPTPNASTPVPQPNPSSYGPSAIPSGGDPHETNGAVALAAAKGNGMNEALKPQMQSTHTDSSQFTPQMDNSFTKGDPSDPLQVATTAGQIKYGGPTSDSDWRRIFPTMPGDWPKANGDSGNQVASANLGAGSSSGIGNNDDDLLRRMRGGVSVPGSDAPGQSYQSPQMQNDGYATV